MAQINKPTDYFNTVLYTGNGTTGHAITGVGFSPDFIWLKNRSATSSHVLANEVVGITSGFLNSDNDNAENTTTIFDSVDADGITINSTGTGQNASGNNYALWNWYTGTTPSSNTDGSITSSVSASTASGFSIVTYTGTGSNATIGHSLNSAPEAIFLKGRDLNGRDWRCFFEPLGNTKFLSLEQTSAATTSSNTWNNTSPTSSVFSIGTNTDVNNSGEDYLAYCFHSVKGYSKIGSYTGNGNADGTFVYTGFKPSLVITKRTSTSGTGWVMMDNKRETTNDGATNYLLANDSVAETSASFAVDFLSNGFKPRTNSGGTNTSGETYIYMAFAENPLVGTNNIPATAR